MFFCIHGSTTLTNIYLGRRKRLVLTKMKKESHSLDPLKENRQFEIFILMVAVPIKKILYNIQCSVVIGFIPCMPLYGK